MNEAGNFTPLPGDNPISDDGDDVLERADVANAFVRKVLELDTRHGTAVGVFAPWGSGKTSFVNLARKTFECKGVRVLTTRFRGAVAVSGHAVSGREKYGANYAGVAAATADQKVIRLTPWKRSSLRNIAGSDLAGEQRDPGVFGDWSSTLVDTIWRSPPALR